MKNAPPILAAVDFSSSSFQVLAHAAKLAAASARSLIAIHVISEGRLKDWEETMDMEAPTTDRMKEITARLQELVTETCGDVPVGITIRIGRPYQVIRDVVNEQAADLLVLGAHDVSKKRLGAVAAHCARALPADVLIVRDWQGQQVRKIAACVDFSPSSKAALGRAIEVARAHQAVMEIIHVIFPPSRDPWGSTLEQPMDDPTSYAEKVRQRAHSRLDTFLEPFRDRLAGIEYSILFPECESPSDVITAHVNTEKIDLTVMGSHDSSWVEDFVLGSNAERLMHDSTSSVLLARARVS